MEFLVWTNYIFIFYGVTPQIICIFVVVGSAQCYSNYFLLANFESTLMLSLKYANKSFDQLCSTQN